MNKPLLPNALRRTIGHTSADTWIGVIMLIAALVYWLEAGKIRISPLDGLVGAAGLPKSLAYVLAGLSLILIARGIAETKIRLRSNAAESEEPRSLGDWIKPHLRAVGMLAIGVVYLLLLPWLGYTITVAMLLFAVSVYNGAQINLRTILVAVIGAAFCQLLFVQFLGITLPTGEFFDRIVGN